MPCRANGRPSSCRNSLLSGGLVAARLLVFTEGENKLLRQKQFCAVWGQWTPSLVGWSSTAELDICLTL
jgi:hypothetical protein